MIQVLVIPNYLPPSLNALLRVHWAQRRRLKQECKDLVAAYAKMDGMKPATGKRKVSLQLTLTGRKQAFDADNIWKAVLDALVTAGLLVDDSPKWCETGEVAQARGSCCETRIVLEDV